MKLRSRIVRLEQTLMPRAWPLLIMEDAPDLARQLEQARRDRRIVIVISAIDAAL